MFKFIKTFLLDLVAIAAPAVAVVKFAAPAVAAFTAATGIAAPAAIIAVKVIAVLAVGHVLSLVLRKAANLCGFDVYTSNAEYRHDLACYFHARKASATVAARKEAATNAPVDNTVTDVDPKSPEAAV